LTIWNLEPVLKFRISALKKDQTTISLVCQEFIDHLKYSLKIFLKNGNQAEP